MGDYSWDGVIQFLKTECKSLEIEKTQWLIEKRDMQEHIAKLQADAKSHKTIVVDMTKRIKMLEFSLRQERIKYAKLTGGHHRVNSDLINSVLNKVEPSKQPAISRRRSRAHRQLLTKYLEEIRYDEIFGSEMPKQTTSTPGHRPSRSYGGPSVRFTGDGPDFRAMDLESKQFERAIQNQTREAPTQIPLQQEEAPARQEESKTETISEAKKSPLEKLAEEDNPTRRQWSQKLTLKNHLDSVRCLHFLENTMVSAGEDCLVKLWDIAEFSYHSEGKHVECYFALRGHTGPIFAMTGYGNRLFTAGIEGVISTWEVPMPNQVDMYGKCETNVIKNEIWQCHDDPIWGLALNEADHQLLSLSSDTKIKLWNAASEQAELLQTYEFASPLTQQLEIPTSAAWLLNESASFVAGYTNPFLTIFDRETGKPTIIRYSQDTITEIEHQTNQLTCVPKTSIIIAGHEDNHIRFFDHNSCQCIKDLVSHTDAVSALSVHPNGNYVVSGSHDGSIRFWDIRTFGCLDEIAAHRKKYDEAIYTIKHSENHPFFASGGADSIIKIYENLS